MTIPLIAATYNAPVQPRIRMPDAPVTPADSRSRLARLLGTDPGPPIGLAYALTTASSALVALFLSQTFGIFALWAVVSAAVVIQPDVKASVSATSLRIVANVIGAGTGAVLAAPSWSQPVAALVLGLFLVAALCRLLGIDAASRSASVAVVIVVLRSPDVLDTWKTRMLGVLLGCAVAFVVTGTVAMVQKRISRAKATKGPDAVSGERGTE